MHVLIFNDQIAGTTDNPESLPTGFTAYDYPGSAPMADLYWDGTDVLPKPAKPSGRHVWSNAARGWLEVAQPSIPPQPQWGQLANDLTTLPVWLRVYDLADTSLPVNNAFTMLQTVLTATKDIARLQAAIAKLRAALTNEAADFDGDELTAINQALTDARFALQLE